MMTGGYPELFKLVLPEAIVVVTALIVLSVDLLLLRSGKMRTRFVVGAGIACIGCVGAISQMLTAPQRG